ncbi:hypothetical protein AgCh_013437 [Apium graveolens]
MTAVIALNKLQLEEDTSVLGRYICNPIFSSKKGDTPLNEASVVGAPHDKGFGYIFDDVESGWTDIPVPTEGSSHVQQVVDRTGVGDAQYRRLTRRMEAIHVIHQYFAEYLTHALGTVVRDIGGEVDWPTDPPPDEGDSPAN